jgi:voltage-gated potassium channel
METRKLRLRLLNRATIIVVLILTLIGVGTVGFRIIEGWPWFTAFYATLMTVSTIGADPLSQLSPQGQAFNVIMILLGVGVVSFAIGLFTQAVIEFELSSFFGRRRMEKDISKLKDHFIICGAGRVGRRLAQEVATRNFSVVFVENDPVAAQWAQARNFPVIIGDASSEEVLRQAHIEHARGLASAVTSDAQNVYIVLTARGLAPNLPIVARASEEDAESKLLKAGATTVISPYSFAGQRMARTLTRPHVQRFLDLALSSLNDGGLDLQIEEIQVAQNCKLSGLRLGETDIRQRLGIMVLAIREQGGRLRFNPGPEDTISPGDYLIAMGDSQKLKELETLAGVKN